MLLRNQTLFEIYYRLKIKRLFSFSLQKIFAMSQTFFFTINSFRELRWLVWLIIHGYFKHRVTASTLDLLNRSFCCCCCGCSCGCCSLSRGLKKKPISFCLLLDIFICLPKTAKK